MLGDPPVSGGLTARLADPRVQPEVADQLSRAGEAPEVTDRRDDRERDGRVDTGDRHQPLDIVACERDLAELRVDDREFLAVEVQLA